jgi:hypothetical protein
LSIRVVFFVYLPIVTFPVFLFLTKFLKSHWLTVSRIPPGSPRGREYLARRERR